MSSDPPIENDLIKQLRFFGDRQERPWEEGRLLHLAANEIERLRGGILLDEAERIELPTFAELVSRVEALEKEHRAEIQADRRDVTAVYLAAHGPRQRER